VQPVCSACIETAAADGRDRAPQQCTTRLQTVNQPTVIRVCIRHHPGLKRYVHVFLPQSFDGKTQFPIWVQLHGVFWATMGDAAMQAGRPINGTDIIPK